MVLLAVDGNFYLIVLWSYGKNGKGLVMKIRKYGEVFLWNSKLSIARSMEYRFDFCLGLFVNLLLALAGPLFQYLIFSQVDGYPGWTVSEIILFQGVLLFLFGLKSLLLGNVSWNIQKLIHRGELDRLLLRPCSSVVLVLANGFSFDGIGTVLAGIVIIVVMLHRLQQKISVLSLAAVVLSVGMGLLLFAAFEILLASVMVRLVNIGRLNELFDTLTKFGQYPMELFPRGAGFLFITMIPFAVWVNIPCRILLDGVQAYMFLTFLMVFFIDCLALYSWNLCIKHYTSAGG